MQSDNCKRGKRRKKRKISVIPRGAKMVDIIHLKKRNPSQVRKGGRNRIDVKTKEAPAMMNNLFMGRMCVVVWISSSRPHRIQSSKFVARKVVRSSQRNAVLFPGLFRSKKKRVDS
jgi:hypothetical protein